MSAKFNLDTMTGIANFEQYAKGIVRDSWNTTWFNKSEVTAAEMWDYEVFQADQNEGAWGYDENDNALALADDMGAASIIYQRVAEDFISSQQ